MNVDNLATIFTAIGIAVTAVMTYLNRQGIQQVHNLTNSMKDQLIATITAQLTAQFSGQIAEQKLQIMQLQQTLDNMRSGKVKDE